jgi:hypothetical protein
MGHESMGFDRRGSNKPAIGYVCRAGAGSGEGLISLELPVNFPRPKFRALVPRLQHARDDRRHEWRSFCETRHCSAKGSPRSCFSKRKRRIDRRRRSWMPSSSTMREIPPVNSANSVGHDIENRQLQVRLIRINAIYLMEMHVITP